MIFLFLRIVERNCYGYSVNIDEKQTNGLNDETRILSWIDKHLVSLYVTDFLWVLQSNFLHIWLCCNLYSGTEAPWQITKVGLFPCFSVERASGDKQHIKSTVNRILEKDLHLSLEKPRHLSNTHSLLSERREIFVTFYFMLENSQLTVLG